MFQLIKKYLAIAIGFSEVTDAALLLYWLASITSSIMSFYAAYIYVGVNLGYTVIASIVGILFGAAVVLLSDGLFHKVAPTFMVMVASGKWYQTTSGFLNTLVMFVFSILGLVIGSYATYLTGTALNAQGKPPDPKTESVNTNQSEKIAAQYDKALDDNAAAEKKALANVGNANMRQLAASGNGWARSKLDAIANVIRAKYATKSTDLTTAKMKAVGDALAQETSRVGLANSIVTQNMADWAALASLNVNIAFYVSIGTTIIAFLSLLFLTGGAIQKKEWNTAAFQSYGDSAFYTPKPHTAGATASTTQGTGVLSAVLSEADRVAAVAKLYEFDINPQVCANKMLGALSTAANRYVEYTNTGKDIQAKANKDKVDDLVLAFKVLFSVEKNVTFPTDSNGKLLTKSIKTTQIGGGQAAGFTTAPLP